MVQEGSIAWTIDRGPGGTLRWTVRGTQDGRDVVLRGESRTQKQARLDIATVITELVTLLRRPVATGLTLT